jgi:diketogulonate reductase-like aldo/keto reductase
MSAAPQPLIARAIPKSGEKIPIVGLGTYRSFDVGGSGPERAAAKEVLRRFVEHGGKLVDSSPMYAPAEEVVGDLASELGVLDKLFMATKVWTDGREAGIAQMQESIRKMRVRRMDLMQVHNLRDLETHLTTLREWKRKGTIRYMGITHYTAGSHRQLEDALRRHRDIDFVQFNYSIAEREAEDRLLPACADLGVAVLANRPFAVGNIFSRTRGKQLPEWSRDFASTWGQFFLKYILGHTALTCAIPATRNPEHVVDNLGAAGGRLPDAATRRRMAEYFGTL